ncbi:hypothetical protein PVAP13_4KG167938 [Panicum virgatum]|uniref:Uncharacterized protein n=1 Tax=Panicum virgatum TaxID=38727 RepID=A0A8T0TM63_PANVG|nr:hypothetical protein PVAP13_4KG167938 [Panicum virgatum]
MCPHPCSSPGPAPRRPRSARPHACTHQQHNHSTRDTSRAKARIRSRASRAMQHAAPRHPRSAKPLPPSHHSVPTPRRVARRAKAVPSAATAAVRHSASASPPTRKAARARQGACPIRPFTACRLCRAITPPARRRRAVVSAPPRRKRHSVAAIRPHHLH